MTSQAWIEIQRARFGLRIDRRGRLWKESEPFEHPGIVTFLLRHIEARGSAYVVQVGEQWVPLEVEDLPLRVRSIHAPPDPGSLTVHVDDGRRNLPSWVQSLRCDAQEQVACSVRSASGNSLLQARLGNAALMQLSEHLDQLDDPTPRWTAWDQGPVPLPDFYRSRPFTP